jgi:hypothetical protein
MLMRNLAVYPITPDEVFACLDDLLADYTDKKLIGGTHGYILGTVIKRLMEDKTFYHDKTDMGF